MPPTATPEIKILLVDDESRNLDALESVLESSEVSLVRANTGDEALMLLIDGDFAAIVLDVQMPGMNGIELANLIKQRKRTQHIPIIFLTAYFQEDKDVLLGYGIGAVDYLTKPVNPQILKMKVNVFVDLYRKTRALIATNGALELEVAQRQKAEDALREMNNALEARVQERTSDLTRVNEALRTSEGHARAASRAKDDFLAALSHELRTPLSPVLLLATEGAANAHLPIEVRADFDTIAKNVALEARLIDDLLDLTRISRGKLTLDRRPTDAHVSIREALAMAREEIDQKKLVVTLDLRAGRSRVRGDDVRLKQVFWNIIKNAAKFTPNHGRITIESIDTPENELRVTVADTGIGMTPAELDRIFEAFSQGDHASAAGLHRFGGMGLGLAISRMMLELHDGSVKAESHGRNQGTTFTIRLPLLAETEELEVDEPSGPIEEVTPSSAPFSEPRRRVLLVEDHKPTSVALSQLLNRRNFQVVEAACVADALGVAKRESFDLLISDIGLPDGNGYELMTELRGRQGLVGIALTGYGMEEDVSKSQAAGFVAHLTKPVTVQALDRALLALTRG
ncbi:MAG TPA: response regulator [Candidatus Didemnitutus sp.]|nr:response regulator [Candidatus Didemnitutus sp.]